MLLAEARRLDAEAQRLLQRATVPLADYLTPMALASLSGLSYLAVWREIKSRELPVRYVTRRTQRRCYVRREDAVVWLVRIGLPEVARSLSSLSSLSSDHTSLPVEV
jgi:hypothetical protein